MDPALPYDLEKAFHVKWRGPSQVSLWFQLRLTHFPFLFSFSLRYILFHLEREKCSTVQQGTPSSVKSAIVLFETSFPSFITHVYMDLNESHPYSQITSRLYLRAFKYWNRKALFTMSNFHGPPILISVFEIRRS